MCRAMATFTRPPTAGPTPRTLWLVLAAPRNFSGAAASASSPARPGTAGAQAPAKPGACDGEAHRPRCSAPITTRSKQLAQVHIRRPFLFWARLRLAELLPNCAQTRGAPSLHATHLGFLPLRPLPFLFLFLFLTSFVLLHGLLAASLLEAPPVLLAAPPWQLQVLQW